MNPLLYLSFLYVASEALVLSSRTIPRLSQLSPSAPFSCRLASWRGSCDATRLLSRLDFSASDYDESAKAEDSNTSTLIVPPAVTGRAPDVDKEVLDQVLAVAIDAAQKAGKIILGNAGGVNVSANKANSRDLLTKIDPLCEQTIQETVHATFSLHDFLGEEDVAPGKEASAAALQAKLQATADNWLWIVDPIDGTTNFVHGMPMSMPSIAATYQGHVMVGVIYDPHRDELYTAVRGRGAFCNGTPITVETATPTESLSQAVVAMGSPPGVESMQMSMAGVQALMPRVRTLRMLGSAALMLAWVAHHGRLTAYWEYDLSSWDMAAGALIIAEAGGKITDLAGQPYTLATRKMCASNGKIHQELLAVLREKAGII